MLNRSCSEPESEIHNTPNSYFSSEQYITGVSGTFESRWLTVSRVTKVTGVSDVSEDFESKWLTVLRVSGNFESRQLTVSSDSTTGMSELTWAMAIASRSCACLSGMSTSLCAHLFERLSPFRFCCSSSRHKLESDP